MNITFDKKTAVDGLLTIQIEPADYEANVKKALKEFAAKATMPGFRPGKVPFGMVAKMYGPKAKLDEVNKLMSDSLFNYIREQKINMLGEPLPNEEQATQDIDNQDSFEFKFDIALAPEFKIELTNKDQIDFYDIEVSDKDVDEQIKNMRSQAGQMQEATTYKDGDVLRGTLTELSADGQPLEGGLVVEKASVMPKYIKDKEQKKLFTRCKKEQEIVFTPSTAYDSETEIAGLLKLNKEEIEQHKGAFCLKVEEISHFEPAALDKALFDRYFGEGNVKDENDFREKVKSQIQQGHVADSEYKFLQDLRVYALQKVGNLQFPEATLKRIMLANNKDKGEDFVEKNFAASIEELKWHLVKEQLAAANGVKVNDDDVKKTAKDAARFQFAQYGMNNIPDEYLEQYAQNILKDQNQVNNLIERCIDEKLTDALKNVVNLKRKNVNIDTFIKLVNGEEKKKK